jgi:hypothetical protein
MDTLLGGLAFALVMVGQVLAVIAVRASTSDEASTCVASRKGAPAGASSMTSNSQCSRHIACEPLHRLSESLRVR